MTTPHAANGVMRFDAGQAPRPEDGIPFEIGGARADGTAWAEQFVAMAEMPAWSFQHLLNAPKVDQGTGAVGYFAPDVIAFLRSVLIDDSQRSRFDRLIQDSGRHVKLRTLVDVMQWLTQRQGEGFPTGAPSDSSGGASPIGPASAAALSAAGYPTPAPQPTAHNAATGHGFGQTAPTQWPPPGGPAAGS